MSGRGRAGGYSKQVGPIVRLGRITEPGGQVTAQPPDLIRALTGMVTEHCAPAGYGLESADTDSDGLLTFFVSLPGHQQAVRLELVDGEVFQLFFPGGYDWAECGHTPVDAREALAAALAFLDAYADPATHEVEVKRFLRGTRTEVRVSNGAVLRHRGLNSDPTEGH